MIIRLKNIRLRAIVGVNPWERNDKQAIIVNVEIEFDGDRAATSDDIADTLDYRTISRKIVDLVENSQFYLIETMADRILRSVLEDPLVQRVRVEVDKPFAVKCADSTSVEVAHDRRTASNTTTV